MTFKPLLAVPITDFAALRFPLFASPKLDGIRCIIRDGVALSRKLKPIPNRYVQSQLAGLPEGLDGELMLDVPGSFAKVSSAIMSAAGEPDFTFWVFDLVPKADGLSMSYIARYGGLFAWGEDHPHPRATVLEQEVMQNIDDLAAYEAKCVDAGFEGCMVRSQEGHYKFGRSTEKQGILLKWKRFKDAEAVIIGFHEQMHNGNPLTVDALGHAKRSSHWAGKTGTNKLGALICRRADGVEFDIGGGFTDAMRDMYWAARDKLPGQLAKYKFQPDPSAPAEAAPRFPIFLGLRHKDD